MVSAQQRLDAAVVPAPYNQAWPMRFANERKLLEGPLRQWLVGPIEHIGSTAVPGLVAKPIIDLMAPVATLQRSLGAIAAAVAEGYVHYPYKPEVMHWFCKPSPAQRTHHLHLVPFKGSIWMQRLAFRDALRLDAELAARYGELKHELAAKFKHDREAYTEAKSSFIQAVLTSAS